MKLNMGSIDRVFRFLLAVGAGILVYMNGLNDVWAYVLLVFGVIMLLTSLVGFCPLYGLFGLNSCRAKPKKG